MSGRPCTICSHEQRSQVEDMIAAAHSIAGISDTHHVSRQAVQRHRDRHMAAPLDSLRDDGIGPFRTVLRMVEATNRLHDLADQAEERGRIADATRATLAESKVLGQLLALGLQGQAEIDYAENAAALEHAVAQLVKRSPVAGDVIAAELESQGRDTYANKLRSFAAKVRALPEHQPKPVSTIKELSHAEH